MKRYLKILAAGIFLALPWVGAASAQNVNTFCSSTVSPPYSWSPCGGGSSTGGLSVQDQAPWVQGTSNFTPGGGVYNDAATLTTGQQGAFRLTAQRAVHVDIDNTNNQIFTSLAAPPNLSVNGANGIWSAVTPGQVQTGTVVAADMNLASVAGTAIGAMSNFGTSPGAVKAIGVNAAIVYGTTAAVADPCQTVAKSYVAVNIAASGSARVIVGTAAKTTYICHMDLVTNATNSVLLSEGTGSNCGTNTFGLIGNTTAASGWTFSANGGISLGMGGYAVLSAYHAAADDVCLNPSASTQLSGQIAYVQQ